jgi:hypothetical protein
MRLARAVEGIRECSDVAKKLHSRSKAGHASCVFSSGNWVQSKPRVEAAGSDCSRPPFLRLLRNRLHTIKPEQSQVADFIAQVRGTKGAAI